MNWKIEKPRHRSPIRRKLGKLFYTFKRAFHWYFGRSKFASKLLGEPFQFLIKEHKSFLLKPLRNVQMHLQHNKIVNLRLAIAHLNGIVIGPGEVFSFWYLVGRPTKRRGYLPGLILNQGKIEEGVGGGLCQLGNLIFWMAIHSPLTIKERYRHGYDVFPDISRTIPFGAGATLSYNYIDLQLENKTRQSFQLQFWLSDEFLNGEIRSEIEVKEIYKIDETKHQIIHQSWGGYTRHNQLRRRIYVKQNNALLEETILMENHAIMMYEPLLTAGFSQDKSI